MCALLGTCKFILSTSSTSHVHGCQASSANHRTVFPQQKLKAKARLPWFESRSFRNLSAPNTGLHLYISRAIRGLKSFRNSSIQASQSHTHTLTCWLYSLRRLLQSALRWGLSERSLAAFCKGGLQSKRFIQAAHANECLENAAPVKEGSGQRHVS